MSHTEAEQMLQVTPTAAESSFALAQREAKALSRSALVPKIYQGDNGVPNCLIAMNLARRMGADPLMVMQNLHVIQGRPGFGAPFLIASVAATSRFSPIRYDRSGSAKNGDLRCTAWAIERETGDRLEGTEITWAMAKAEGWVDKQGSKWKTMPEQMICYRAAAFWQRLYAPEVSMGLLSVEELRDISTPEPAAQVRVTVSGEDLERLVMDDAEVIEDGEEIPPPHTEDTHQDDPV